MSRSLTPDLLRAFLLVQEHGTFLAAAAAGGMAASTLKYRIEQLEAAVGQPLFKRHSGGRRAEPTAAGRRLHAHAVDLVERHDAALSAASGTRKSERLRLGITEDHAATLLPKVLEIFKKAHPDTELEVETGMTLEMRRAVPERYDLVLALQQENDPDGEVIGSEPLAWVCHEDAVIGDDASLALYPKGCLYRSLAETALARAGLDGRTTLSTLSRSAIEQAITAGAATGATAGAMVSVLPATTVKRPLRQLNGTDGYPDLPSLAAALYLRSDAGIAARTLAAAIETAHAQSRHDTGFASAEAR